MRANTSLHTVQYFILFLPLLYINKYRFIYIKWSNLGLEVSVHLYAPLKNKPFYFTVNWTFIWKQINSIQNKEKQEAHEPHHLPKKPVPINNKFVQSYYCTITPIKRKIIKSFFRTEWSYVFNNMRPVLHTRMKLCQVWLNLAQWFWKRWFSSNFINIFFAFSLSLNPLHPRMLYAKFEISWIWQVVLEKHEFHQISSMYFFAFL